MASRSNCVLIPACLALLSVVVTVSKPQPPRPSNVKESVSWHDSLDAAFQLARRSGRDVLVNFTARRYCHYCTLLAREVLIREEFLDYVGARFVLVEIDKSLLEDDDAKKDTLRRIEAWEYQYRVGFVPTVFLLDVHGQPFGTANYQPGGAVKFVEFLRRCQVARERRDKLLQEAQSLTGPARAAKLDEALSVINEVLSDDVSLDEPPLTVFHSTEIDDILRLEPNANSPLHQKYARMRVQASEERSRKALSQKFDEIADENGNDAAIKYADELLAQTTDKSLRKRLKRYRIYYLNLADRNHELLAAVLEELDDPELTASERRSLEHRKVYTLDSLGQRDEALAFIDRCIAEAGDDRERKRKAWQDKGQFLIGKNEREAALAFEAAAELSDDGSEPWWENNGLSAWRFLVGKDHKTAKQVHARLLSRPDTPPDIKPHLLLGLMESLLALGERPQAKALRPQLQQALNDCPKELLEPGTAKELLEKCDQLLSTTTNAHTQPQEK